MPLAGKRPWGQIKLQPRIEIARRLELLRSDAAIGKQSYSYLISPQKGDFLPFGFGDGDALG
jgi:hypothetical protein